MIVLWYLARQKDERQQKEIDHLRDEVTNKTDVLFKKHDADAAELQQLKLQIASQHYVKGELDNKFDKLETSFREGMQAMGQKFDKLADAILKDKSP